MKIAILTWLHNGNYGSVLQAYALQRILRDQGYETENVDYAPSTKQKVINLIVNRNSPKLFLEKWDSYLAKKATGASNEIERKNRKFDMFCKEYINLTERYYSPNQIRKIIGKYDAYICGSDQIWSPVLLNPVYYLDFLNLSDKKISYACSFGVAEVDKKKQNKISNYLKRFDAISVREAAGKEIVKSLIGKDVPVMPDPTLLLSKDRWNSVAKSVNCGSKYVFCYFLTWNKEYWEYANEVSSELDCEIVIVPSVKETYNVKARVIKDAGPEEWIGLVKNAAYIITDSFHGTVFSLIFNKQFTILKRFSDDNPKSQNSRIHTLLNRYDINSRLGVKADIFSQIDYEKINNSIEQDRIYALNWIKEKLGEENKTK